MNIGILALQGAFIEHKKMLDKLGINSFEIRKLSDLDQKPDGLIIPGGESTVMGKLLHELGLFEPMRKLILDGLPVFGTCAGLVLLSKSILNDETSHFATMDIVCKRNAYGRQLGSFDTIGNFKGIGEIPMRFIRAPYIYSAESDVDILAVVDDKIVAARQNNQLVTAFHPELTSDTYVHEYFVKMVTLSIN